MQMWNNPSCSKCATVRQTLAAARLPVTLRAYLDDPPSAAELADVLRRLPAEPWDICRTSEPAAAALGVAAWPRTAESRARWIDVMVSHPELIQRPILLLDDGRALIARTPEALREALPDASDEVSDPPR